MGLPDKTGTILTDEQKQQMQQARKDAQSLIDKMYKKDYPSDLENMWKSLAEKAIELHNSKLPDGEKESLRTMCCYMLEGNVKC